MKIHTLIRAALLVCALFLVGCASTNYGDDRFELQRATQGKDVMWIPTQVEMAHQMFVMTKLSSKDLLYDLGSGDGVIPIEAAKKYRAHAMGIEYNPDLVALSQRNAVRENVQALVTFKQGDIFIEDFSQATVLTLYLGENLNIKLMPKILKMRPGTRVVSNTFPIESWIPDQERQISTGEMMYYWVVPAAIDGNWMVTGLPSGEGTRLNIVQKKQFFDGNIEVTDKRPIYFEEGKINGIDLTYEFTYLNTKYVFTGQVHGSEIRGLLNNDPALKVLARRAPE
ncbi:methyltransferase domain-containing protein [Polynucleobacter antarcticus]|uniref:SAM-dependent methyltransferase n=1 Tax=Polynucleobacter antarcticus TaxID=1743162 RepID=A0A6M9PS78_9BURK|nr:methyltransferase domain-containing protein [Polynucleobacter antarcticus]QKM63509.1 SAM-dependent methyltransferase [Polynucleobacter antarcticus]